MEPKTIKIHIGEYHASHNPARIYTLLGSCVAVCFFDPLKRIGGMNHILLPGKANLNSFNSAASYGINAMELLINRIMKLGGDRRRLEAKVFGGGHIISAISEKYCMGQKNSEFAINFLNNEGIKIVNSDLGGCDARKVVFFTESGRALLKHIPSLYGKLIGQKEAYKYNKMKKGTDNTGGDITIF